MVESAVKSVWVKLGLEEVLKDNSGNYAHPRNLGYRLGSLPSTYLGVPLISSGLKLSHCRSLLTKVRDKAMGCENKCLSYAGRVDFIRKFLDLAYSSAFFMGLEKDPVTEATASRKHPMENWKWQRRIGNGREVSFWYEECMGSCENCCTMGFMILKYGVPDVKKGPCDPM
ncbi:hypothetical protein AKJ16_DCAP13179 [Drosera capensis]